MEIHEVPPSNGTAIVNDEEVEADQEIDAVDRGKCGHFFFIISVQI